MNTITKWLDNTGFDWENGKVIYQAQQSLWANVPDTNPGGIDPSISAEYVGREHPILNKEFEVGHGTAECPRFIAKDGEATYFPYQYDGATGLVKVFNHIEKYLDPHNTIPYPGDG